MQGEHGGRGFGEAVGDEQKCIGLAVGRDRVPDQVSGVSRFLNGFEDLRGLRGRLRFIGEQFAHLGAPLRAPGFGIVPITREIGEGGLALRGIGVQERPVVAHVAAGRFVFTRGQKQRQQQQQQHGRRHGATLLNSTKNIKQPRRNRAVEPSSHHSVIASPTPPSAAISL